jgi:hypothetical protein
MISDICQRAINTNSDRTKVQDIHDECQKQMKANPGGEKCGCDCH